MLKHRCTLKLHLNLKEVHLNSQERGSLAPQEKNENSRTISMHADRKSTLITWDDELQPPHHALTSLHTVNWIGFVTKRVVSSTKLVSVSNRVLGNILLLTYTYKCCRWHHPVKYTLTEVKPIALIPGVKEDLVVCTTMHCLLKCPVAK